MRKIGPYTPPPKTSGNPQPPLVSDVAQELDGRLTWLDGGSVHTAVFRDTPEDEKPARLIASTKGEWGAVVDGVLAKNGTVPPESKPDQLTAAKRAAVKALARHIVDEAQGMAEMWMPWSHFVRFIDRDEVAAVMAMPDGPGRTVTAVARTERAMVVPTPDSDMIIVTVGDFVRAVVDRPGNVRGILKGDALRVTDVDQGGVFVVRLGDPESEEWCLDHNEVEAWAPRVGERVRVRHSGLSKVFARRVGDVDRVAGRLVDVVSLLAPGCQTRGWRAEELEPVAPWSGRGVPPIGAEVVVGQQRIPGAVVAHDASRRMITVRDRSTGAEWTVSPDKVRPS